VNTQQLFHRIQAGFIVNNEPLIMDVMVTNREEADEVIKFMENLEEVAMLRLMGVVPMTFEEVKAKVGEIFDKAMSKNIRDLRNVNTANTVAA